MSLNGENGTQLTMPVMPAGGMGGYGMGGFGGDGWWGILFLIAIMCGGWGGLGGFGGMGGMMGMWPFLFGGFGNGFGGGSASAQGALTREQACIDNNFQNLMRETAGISDAVNVGFANLNSTICHQQYDTAMLVNGVNNNITQGFHGVDNAICNLGYQTQQGFNAANVVALQGQNALQTQLADCCCGLERGIDGVNYNMATNTCALQNTIQNTTRDIIDNANANSRAILDYLCKDKIDTLQQENQTLRLAASQAAQNNVIGARIDAATAEILRKTGSDCPLPAYIVQPPQPVSFATNCSGQATFNNGYGYGNCGCNNGCCGCNG